MLLVPALRADEGMWMLPLLEKMNSDALRSLGCRLTPEQIYSINNSSIKDAVVQFGGGCTGEIISGDGLLVTNHHCGYGSIQSLSSTEHNYLEDGYWAKSRTEEIPVPGLTVRFLQSMTDVTDQAQTKEDAAACLEKYRAANPGCEVSLTNFFNDNYTYVIVSKIYRDVRFVGAPPASSGKFGGDTDNWMWPRHTCDFSMFRVYAGPDNEPAAYSETNVPMHPRQFLGVSLKGVQEGDFAMIMGYPGSTQRFQTAAQLQNMLDLNEVSIAARGVRQDIMWKAMRADEKTGLQYASKYASSSNGWKKWIGEREAFAKLDVIGREKQKEADFAKWVAKKAKRQKAYGTAVADLEDVCAQRAGVTRSILLLSESIGRIELVTAVRTFTRAITGKDHRPDYSPESLQRAQAAMAGFYKNYNADLDREISEAMVDFYFANAGDSAAFDRSDIDLDKLFGQSAFVSPEKVVAIDSKEALLADPAYQFSTVFTQKLMEIYLAVSPETIEKQQQASKAFTAGLLEWKKGEPQYPDANSTCRLTYGTVKGYEPKDGVIYKYYTTLKGVMEKEDPSNYEFRVPAKLKEIYEAKDYGQYANADGELPTCFLTNLDITGGNSGSPVLDADGNLIGLAFDGNWEAMSGDVIFEPNLQRCICVDIRYVLLMMDKFGGAGYLLDEMKLVK